MNFLKKKFFDFRKGFYWKENLWTFITTVPVIVYTCFDAHFRDEFNEPCTAVIVKKKNWHAKFLYATHLSAPTWLKWFNIFKNLFLLEYLQKRDFGGF